MNANPDDLSAHPDLGRSRRRDALGVGGRSSTTPTADAQEQFQRHQTFRDWLIDAMHAGDRLAVTVVDQRFTGTVEEVGDDLLGLRAMFGRVDIHLAPGIPMHIELVDHPTSGGHRGKTDGSFAAALAARDPERRHVDRHAVPPEGLDGLVTAGRDFVIVRARAGAVTVIPITEIAWVCNRRI